MSRMQCVTTDQLHVERDHFPLQRMLAHHDFLPAQTAAGIFHDGERLRQDFRQLPGQFLMVLDCAQLRLPSHCFGAQFLVGQLVQPHFDFIDLHHHRADFPHIPVVLRRKKFSKKSHNSLSITLFKNEQVRYAREASASKPNQHESNRLNSWQISVIMAATHVKAVE